MISIFCGSILRQTKPRLHLLRTTELSSGLARLLSSLAVLEQKDGKIITGSLGAVTAAQKLGGSITAFLAGSNIRSVAESVARVQGVEKVIAVDNDAYDKVQLPHTSSYFHALLIVQRRASRRTMRHSLWKTSEKGGTPTFWQATRPMAKI